MENRQNVIIESTLSVFDKEFRFRSGDNAKVAINQNFPTDFLMKIFDSFLK